MLLPPSRSAADSSLGCLPPAPAQAGFPASRDAVPDLSSVKASLYGTESVSCLPRISTSAAAGPSVAIVILQAGKKLTSAAFITVLEQGWCMVSLITGVVVLCCRAVLEMQNHSLPHAMTFVRSHSNRCCCLGLTQVMQATCYQEGVTFGCTEAKAG